MIIRSQDKKSITNFQQLTDVGIIKNNGVFAIRAYYPFSVGDEYSKMNLGLYSTEEKAIKVLDMICEKYKEPIVRANYTNEESLIYANSVFQMPQDSEV